jgi:putative DNA primase/helicase
MIPAMETIPSELQARPTWLTWNYEARDGKQTKIPIDVHTGKLASTTNPETWATFQEAVTKRNGAAGLGFVFDGSGICGIDLDKCRDPKTGEIQSWAQEIIRALDSYTEISPSGTGVHIILRGKLPAGGNRKGHIEMYDRGRFFCMTGNHLEGTPATVEDRQSELCVLHSRTFGKQKDETKNNGHRPQGFELGDEEILDKARNAANGAKFRALFDAGEWEGYPSQSEADSALCMMLAFYCGKDEARVDRLFRRSALMREKWDSKRADSTYGAETVHRACAKATDTYTPKSKPAAAATDPAEDLGTPLPEVGLVKRLADSILKRDHFAQDVGGSLYVYQAGFYHQRGEEHVRRCVKRQLEDWQCSKAWSSTRGNEVAEYIRLDAPPLWDRPPLDRVNVANGILEIEEKRLIAHDPGYLSSVQLPVKYDPAAECHFWDHFIEDVFPDDAQDVAWELLAWLMTPNTSLQKAGLLLGEGSNGKSRYLAAVTSFLGRRNTSSISLHRLEDDKFSTARLIGKLANICPDLPSEHLTSTSTFKAIVGGDIIPAERKYCDSFEFSPFCRLLFSANNPPRSTDSSAAFFRRWLVIPFEATFDPGSDRYIPADELDRRLGQPGELSGVLNRALDAFPRLADGITEAESMRKAADEFRQTTDPLAVWLAAELISKAEIFISKADLLAAYNRACELANRPIMTRNAFGRSLSRHRPGLQEAQRTVNGKLDWVWLGIGLRQHEVT